MSANRCSVSVNLEKVEDLRGCVLGRRGGDCLEFGMEIEEVRGL